MTTYLISLLRRLAFAMLLPALASCGGGHAEDVTFTALAGDFYGAWPVKNYVVKTEAEWEAAWLEHTSFLGTPPSKPTVDFQANAVLGVSLGWGSSCESVVINKITRDGNTHVVEYRRPVLPPDLLCAGVAVPLITFVLVPAPVAEAVFKRVD